MRYVLPHLAGFLLPTLIFALVYVLQGENPAWGAVAGVIGLMGSLAAELLRIPLERRSAEKDMVKHWENVVRERAEHHEGLERLHVDIRNDDRFRDEEK